MAATGAASGPAERTLPRGAQRRSPLGRLEVRVEVEPPWVFRLPGGGMDGVLRRRDTVLERLLHIGGEPAVVRVAQPAPDRVVFGARAATEEAGHAAIERMRFAVGVDDDLAPFYDAYRDDPLIGPSVRANPGLRVRRRPEPFEALAWAVTEQLIETVRAFAIQRRIVFGHGPRAAGWDGASVLHDVPDAAALAGVAPARLVGYDLAETRALTLRRVARAVAHGGVDLHAPDHERHWLALRRIPGVGSWTIAMLALHGQGRYDVLPSGDLGYVKLVGRLHSGGDPRARATEADVNDFFARFGAWRGLAGSHALRSVGLLTL